MNPALHDAGADPRPDEHHPARWWHALPDGRIQCDGPPPRRQERAPSEAPPAPAAPPPATA